MMEPLYTHSTIWGHDTRIVVNISDTSMVAVKDFYGDETTDIFNHAVDEPPSSISAIFYSADQNLAIVGIDSNVLQDQHRKDYWEEYLNLYKAKYLADDPSDDKIERLKIDYWPGWIDVDLLDQRLEEAKINCPNATLAVAMHHPLAGRFREIHSLDYRPILNCDDVLNILAKHDVALVMHGHKHISDLYSLHHRGSNADKGWHLAVAQAGSMCKSDNPEWQPRDVPPAFNMIRLQLPASKAVMHIQSDVLVPNTTRSFEVNDPAPYQLRIETKKAYEKRISDTPRLDTLEGQADWKLISKMDTLRIFDTFKLQTNVGVTDYAEKLERLAREMSRPNFIWMTCCVTPSYLMEQNKTHETLERFVKASDNGVEVTRIFVLGHSDYLEMVRNVSELEWFWDNACAESTKFKLFCTCKEWLTAIPDFKFADIDFVMYGGRGRNPKQRIADSHTVAYLGAGFTGEYLGEGHIVNLIGREANQKGIDDISLLFTMDGLSDVRKQKLKRCLVPCWTKDMFVGNIQKHLLQSRPPSAKETQLMYDRQNWVS